ncbi:MAG TPA: response regulator [Nitrosopumilaceae archaeon]|nr:response regulator [Nitrosopumilaceae archaeon]
MSSQKKNILIIEDSLAVASLMQDFLKKLDYQEIYISDTGRNGIQVFENLVKSNKTPVVILDYRLPDMNADEIMTEIFKIKPNTKIIIESANEKTDESIKDVLRSGAYEYLEKPIRFENLKNTMRVLEDEDKILVNKSPESQTSQTQINSLLNSSVQISLARISEYCHMSKEETIEHLKKLESDGKIIKLDDIKEISCNLCNSMKIGQTFHCPSCGNSNFKQGTLIEHYKCGNFSSDDSYKDNICPKCRKEIKVLGVDYKLLKNYYICDSCGNKFPDPTQEYLCLKCNNNFKLEQAKWIVSSGFRAVNL